MVLALYFYCDPSTLAKIQLVSHFLSFSLTDALQAIFAFLTLYITYIIYRQEKKIKTLTDLVDELQKHTCHLGKQADELAKQTQSMELSTKIMAKKYLSEAPSFKFDGNVNRKEPIKLIQLKNTSCIIKKILPIINSGISVDWEKKDQLLYVGDKIEIWFMFDASIGQIFKNGQEFLFTMELEDTVSNTFYQRFKIRLARDYSSYKNGYFADCIILFDPPRLDATGPF